MEYVKRQKVPPLLQENQEVWTQPWVQYYREIKGEDNQLLTPNKPTTSHWLKDEIRRPLIEDFQNNCGYCGRVIPTPYSSENEEPLAKGDVDHLIPKSVKPELVYEWSNYIWSSKESNQQKGDFYDEEFPILDPCSESDCNLVRFDEATGKYVLNQAYTEDPVAKQRLEFTAQKTMMNAEELSTERKNRITELTGAIDSLRIGLETREIVKGIADSEQTSSIQKKMEELIKSNSDRLNVLLQHPSYKLLTINQFKYALANCDDRVKQFLQDNLSSPQCPELFD